MLPIETEVSSTLILAEPSSATVISPPTIQLAAIESFSMLLAFFIDTPMSYVPGVKVTPSEPKAYSVSESARATALPEAVSSSRI